MTGWLFGEPPEPEAALEAEIVPAGGDESVEPTAPGGISLVDEVVDELYRETRFVTSASMAFADIEEDQEEPPQEWIDEFGEKEAKKRLRIAKYAQLPHNKAPIALEIAQKVVTGITKAKMERPGQDRVLNVQIVQFEKQEKDFPELLLEPKKGKKRGK